MAARSLPVPLRLAPLAAALIVVPSAAPAAAGRAEVTVCTQNLWNYGTVEDLRRHRFPSKAPGPIRRALDDRERELVKRMRGCDVIAVQELIGGGAGEALGRLARLLGAAGGRPYASRIAPAREGTTIRNGFLFSERTFPEAHLSGIDSRRPTAELLLAAPANGGGAIRLRIVGVHLKSKAERAGGDRRDANATSRARIAQAADVVGHARAVLAGAPGELLIVAGDLNDGRGSATRAVLSGRIDAGALLSREDCLGPAGGITCRLPARPPVLIDLLARDPDLHGRGSYRYRGREELIDGLFASPAAARAAREPGAGAGDFDVALAGSFYRGSDHLLAKVTLRPKAADAAAERPPAPDQP